MLSREITSLRKSRGWSQEELAKRLDVSRQTVSKWESSAAQPEVDRIVALSELFGVTTDSLLKGEAALPAVREAPAPEGVRVFADGDSRDYLRARTQFAEGIARGVALCVTAPAPLLLLELFGTPLAEALGCAALLELVALAVYLFVTHGMSMSKYSDIDRGNFLLTEGEAASVAFQRQAYRPHFTQSIAVGVGLCVLSPVPVVLLDSSGAGYLANSLGPAVLLIVVALGVYCFVREGIIMRSFDRLLSSDKAK